MTALQAATSPRVTVVLPPGEVRAPLATAIVSPAAVGRESAAASSADVQVALPHAGGDSTMWRSSVAEVRPVDGASRVKIVPGALNAAAQLGADAAASATEARPAPRSVASRV